MEQLNKAYGKASRTLILRIDPSQPYKKEWKRPLNVCVVQTSFPRSKEFQQYGLTLRDSEVRRKHRQHLTSSLAAVNRMLELKHINGYNKPILDLLILPELSVHPDDIHSCLIPFSRANKSIILAGLTYDTLTEKCPLLINSAVWIIPQIHEQYGLQIRALRQIKKNLNPTDHGYINKHKEDTILGFRPCQWIIGYPWSDDKMNPHQQLPQLCAMIQRISI